jgi:DNA-binding transcriptional LysR family regulator
MPLPFSLRQLEHFSAIARAGSLARAAETCHVSPTALALSLSELERNLNLQLVVRRKGKGITLTPAGTSLLHRAQQVLADAELFASEAQQDATRLTGRLVIGCYLTLTPFFLPVAMERFGAEHSGLELAFEEAPTPVLHDLLLRGQLDVAILYGVDVSGQLEFEPIAEYRPFIIVGEGHRLSGRKSVKLEELADDPLIQIDMRPSLQNTEYIFASLSLRPQVRYRTTNYELARSLVGRNLGYSLLIQRPASQLTYDGHRVVSLEIEDDLPPTVVGLARPRGAPRTAKYAALFNFLVTHAKARQGTFA